MQSGLLVRNSNNVSLHQSIAAAGAFSFQSCKPIRQKSWLFMLSVGFVENIISDSEVGFISSDF